MHRALLTVAVVGLVAAGCSDSGTASTEPPATTAPAPTAASTTATPAASVTTVTGPLFDFTLPGPAPERVELSTSDGVPIVVDLYRGGEQAFVIGHGNNQDRTAPPAPTGAPFYETLGSELVAGMMELFGLA